MALEMKESSSWWYAKIRVRGKNKLQLVKLDLKIEGRRPRTLGEVGDDVFERSRGQAMEAHKKVVGEINRTTNLEELSQRIIEIKTGSRADGVTFDKLFEAWQSLPHEQNLGKSYVSFCKGTIDRFCTFMKTFHPDVKDLAGVRRGMMADFMTAEENRGASARTWTAGMILIRSLFKYLQPDSDAYRRYLVTVRGKTSETVHRVPFTATELQAILDASKNDDLIRPLIVVAASTAMRRGDCCLLKWSSVDLEAGFITVKTSKTGETVDMPIFPMLRDELEKLTPSSEYVFPDAAKLYLQNPDNLNVRLRQVLKAAGFKAIAAEDEEKKKVKKKKAQKKLPTLSPEETRAKALKAVAMIPGRQGKRDAMTKTIELYLTGKSLRDVARQLRVSKGTISGHLNAIEKIMGTALVRTHQEDAPATRGDINTAKTNQRMRSANVRGWHSFRTTFITLALAAGLPMELVRRVSGHTTADVVLKHYFRPGREDFRLAMIKSMPKVLTGNVEPVVVKAVGGGLDEGEKLARSITALKALNGKNWKKTLDEALPMLEQVMEWYDHSRLRGP